MTFGVSKRASSADPRDWHYLRAWQLWARYMPPWQYSFEARWMGLPSIAPFFGRPTAFTPDPTLPHTTNQGCDVEVFLPEPEPPYFSLLFHFAYGITVFPPSVGFLDPLGNPCTLILQGEFELDGFSPGYFFGSWWLPPYDQVLDTVVRETQSWTGAPHSFYPLGIYIRPVPWDHPVSI